MGESRRLVHRRTVAKGTAWAVPVIVAAAGTPAFASSVCTTTCSDLTASTGALNFGTGTTWNTTTNSFGNGWTGANRRRRRSSWRAVTRTYSAALTGPPGRQQGARAVKRRVARALRWAQ